MLNLKLKLKREEELTKRGPGYFHLKAVLLIAFLEGFTSFARAIHIAPIPYETSLDPYLPCPLIDLWSRSIPSRLFGGGGLIRDELRLFRPRMSMPL